ncbi:MAG: glycosyltransferase family 2 protein [Acidobacteria bacterium]|nr:glycosyltransferase family 2 protein [Acidobacteriota bacterium]
MGSDFRVAALIAAYNEADIIGQVVEDLIRQRVDVYVLDNRSTDGIAEVLQPFLGRGLLRIESFPPERDAADEYNWTALLQRKEELAQELEADWFIHQDADEFREGPWDGLDLYDAIRRVDAFGYNAIDFEVLNFWPTDPDGSGSDVRASFRFFERGREWDKIQIKCWKNPAGRVDLLSTGGHEAIFVGRRVFPIRFLLRHYPIRGQAHAERKIFRDRLPRFLAAERGRGWHRQYDEFRSGQSFLREPGTLLEYDSAEVRLHLALRHRNVEALEQQPSGAQSLLDEAARYSARLEEELEIRNRHLARLHADLTARNGELARLHQELSGRNEAIERLHADLNSRNESLSLMHADLSARNESLLQLHAELDARNREVQALSAALDAQNRAVVRLEEELHVRNREVEGLHGELDASRLENRGLQEGPGS